MSHEMPTDTGPTDTGPTDTGPTDTGPSDSGARMPSTAFSAGAGHTGRELTADEERHFARQQRNARLMTASVVGLATFGILAMIWGQTQVRVKMHQKHDSAGQLVSETTYTGAERTGYARTYFAGHANPKAYRAGPDGFALAGHTGGIETEGHFLKGLKDGTWRTYDKQGRLREETRYKRGRWFGDYKSFHPNGQVESLVTFGPGEVRTGIGRSYYPNGTLASEQPYRNGRVNGTERRWFENGQLRIEAPAVDGMAHGRTRRWHKNGQLQSEGMFSAGERVGIWSEYDEEGKLVLQVNWDKAGEVVLTPETDVDDELAKAVDEHEAKKGG